MRQKYRNLERYLNYCPLEYSTIMVSSEQDKQLIRKQLANLLSGKESHTPFQEAIQDLPFGLTGIVPEKVTYSIWQEVEHMRIAQHDILAFTTDPSYESPSWPDQYWPDSPVPPSEDAWNQSVDQVLKDWQKMIDLVENPNNDLFAPIPQGKGETLFREAALLSQHNAYHTGQIILMRRLLDAW